MSQAFKYVAHQRIPVLVVRAMFWGLRLEANCLCTSSCMHLALMVATSRSTDYGDHPTTTNTTTIAIIVTIGQWRYNLYELLSMMTLQLLSCSRPNIYGIGVVDFPSSHLPWMNVIYVLYVYIPTKVFQQLPDHFSKHFGSLSTIIPCKSIHPYI